MENEERFQFDANIGSVATGTAGGYRMRLDIFNPVAAMSLLGLYQKNVRVTVEVLPDEQ